MIPHSVYNNAGIVMMKNVKYFLSLCFFNSSFNLKFMKMDISVFAFNSSNDCVRKTTQSIHFVSMHNILIGIEMSKHYVFSPGWAQMKGCSSLQSTRDRLRVELEWSTMHFPDTFDTLILTSLRSRLSLAVLRTFPPELRYNPKYLQ